MTLRRPRYRVTLAPPPGSPESTEPLELEVEVAYADQLRAELEAGKLGLPTVKDAPQNAVAMWLWCACVRLGYYTGKAQQFRTADLLDLEALDTPDEVPAVDPTPPAPTTEPA